MNKNLLAGLVAASLLVGGGGATALAATGAPAAASTVAVVSGTSRGDSCGGPLGSLVTKGTITQKQAVAIHDAVVSYVQGHWHSMLDTVLGQLVKAHTITQAQANEVSTELTQWAQKYHANGSGHEGSGHESPCPHSSDMGGSGSR
jgi:hypothetical protein